MRFRVVILKEVRIKRQAGGASVAMGGASRRQNSSLEVILLSGHPITVRCT